MIMCVPVRPSAVAGAHPRRCATHERSDTSAGASGGTQFVSCGNDFAMRGNSASSIEPDQRRVRPAACKGPQCRTHSRVIPPPCAALKVTARPFHGCYRVSARYSDDPIHPRLIKTVRYLFVAEAAEATMAPWAGY
jgi:hypothetical protein